MEPRRQSDEGTMIGADQPAVERSSRSVVWLAVIGGVIPVAFLAMGVVRAYPFADDVQVPARVPDDWHTYKQLALSVMHDGLSMPAVASSFGGLPHGFLYIYFLALLFTVAGVNATYVYVV